MSSSVSRETMELVVGVVDERPTIMLPFALTKSTRSFGVRFGPRAVDVTAVSNPARIG